MELEIIMLRKLSQKEKYCIFAQMWNLDLKKLT
jgi:hypothetical protein